MPVTYYVDSVRKVVFTYFYGDVTKEEVGHHLAQIDFDPTYRTDFDQFVDCTGIIALSAQTDGPVAPHQSDLFDYTSRVAVVANTKCLSEMLGLYELIHPDKTQMRGFESRELAQQWLGISSKRPAFAH